MPRVRRCFVCLKKDCVARVFLRPNDPDEVPVCPDGHGRMVRDSNEQYFGKPTAK